MVINGSLPDEFNPKDKSTYHWIFDHVYRVQKMDINHIIAFRRHNVSKLEIQNINGKKENPGRLFKTPASINIVKILVNPAGFIELG
jgi:hypothetical protein